MVVKSFANHIGKVEGMEKVENHGLLWIDFEHFKEKHTRYLRQKFHFHPLDLKDCLSVTGTPKLDIYEDYLFLVLHLPEYSSQEQRILYRELNIFMGKGYLVTLHRDRFLDLEAFMNYLKKNEEARDQLMKKGPGFLLYHLIGPMFKKVYEIVDRIGDNIFKIEAEIYKEETIDLVKELAIERRKILNCRRIIEPQRHLIGNLVQLRRDFLGHESEVYFDDIRDHIQRIWMLLENFREIVRGLHDTNEALISHKTNEVMKVLTIISVLLLPLNLIAGIYGMNITGLPFAGSPSSLWIILVIMLLLITGMMFFFRRRKLL